MSNIILLADAHFHTKIPHNTVRANLLADDIINTKDPKEHLIVLPGDLMDTPTPKNAALAQRWISRFREADFDVVAAPGNHDVYKAGVDMGIIYKPDYGPWRTLIDPVLSWQTTDWPRAMWWGGVQIIGLDTQQGTAGDAEIDLAQGCVGEDQLTELTIMLQDSPSLVFGHHHAWWRDAAHLLEDAEALRAIIEGRALGFACGHRHERFRKIVGSCAYHAGHRCTELWWNPTLRIEQLRYDVIQLKEGLPYELNHVDVV